MRTTNRHFSTGKFTPIKSNIYLAVLHLFSKGKYQKLLLNRAKILNGVKVPKMPYAYFGYKLYLTWFTWLKFSKVNINNFASEFTRQNKWVFSTTTYSRWRGNFYQFRKELSKNNNQKTASCRSYRRLGMLYFASENYITILST